MPDAEPPASSAGEAQAADAVVDAGQVVVVRTVRPFGVGHAGQAAVVRAAGHLAVGVLDLRRGRGVHGAAVGLVLGGELAEAVERVLHLVDDVPPLRRVVAGEQVRPPGRVVGRLQPQHRPVHVAGCPAAVDRVGGHAAQHVVGVRVDASRSGRCSVVDVAQRVVGVDLLVGRGRAGVAAGLVGVPDLLQQVVAR